MGNKFYVETNNGTMIGSSRVTNVTRLDVIGNNNAISRVGGGVFSTTSSDPFDGLTYPSPSAQAAGPLIDSEILNRITLFQTLSALAGAQFECILFALQTSAGIIPDSNSAQGNRVSALLNWAEGPGGCGLERVVAVLDSVLRHANNQSEGFISREL